MGSTEVPMEEMTNKKITFTEIKDYIMSFPPKTKLVWIHDACLTRGDLECLFHDEGWLCGDVINAYIYYLWTQDHANNRAGGKAWMDSTHVVGILKRDAEIPISPEEHGNIIKRSLNYLQHDMLLVPINVTKAHWFLSNVDAKNRRIQVLNSFGDHMSRSDLQLTNHLLIASQSSDFSIGTKWPDLEVTKWPVVEYIHEPMQSDGSSCGLFMLKFMEFFTGHKLAHAITQKYINLFRRQLPIILHESVLNELKGRPEYPQPETTEYRNEVVMWDKNDPLPTQLSQTSQFANDSSPSLKVPNMPFNKDEIMSRLRSYIMSIRDNNLKKQIWVHSSRPYPISLSLKQLQDLLKKTRGIEPSSFNMVVRVNATDEVHLCNDTPYYFMDLQFCNILTDTMRDPRLRLTFDTQRYIIARMFDSWPGMGLYVSSCNSILIPYRSARCFILFEFNLSKRTITILDPLPFPDVWKGSLHKDTIKLKDISFHLNIALQDAIPGWNDDLFRWPRITPDGLPRNHDSNMSGFLVLKYMRWWNGKEVARADATDGFNQRNKVLVHLLAYKDNETEANIPQVVKDLVNILGTEYFI